MMTNYQCKHIDIVLLTLEDLFDYYKDPKDIKFVSSRIDYFTNRWAELKAGIKPTLSDNELIELRLGLQTYLEVFGRDLSYNNDPYRLAWFKIVEDTQKALVFNG